MSFVVCKQVNQQKHPELTPIPKKKTHILILTSCRRPSATAVRRTRRDEPIHPVHPIPSHPSHAFIQPLTHLSLNPSTRQSPQNPNPDHKSALAHAHQETKTRVLRVKRPTPDAGGEKWDDAIGGAAHRPIGARRRRGVGEARRS